MRPDRECRQSSVRSVLGVYLRVLPSQSAIIYKSRHTFSLVLAESSALHSLSGSAAHVYIDMTENAASELAVFAMHLNASDHTLGLLRDVCRNAVNMPFTQSFARTRRCPQAALSKLYGRRMNALPREKGVVVIA